MPSFTTILTLLTAATCAVAAPAPQSPAAPAGEVDPVGVLAPSDPVDVSGFAAATFADGTFKNTVLKHHNVHRTNHSSPAVTWGANMAKYAAEVAATCVWKHNTSVGGGNYGQNIAAGTPKTGISDVITDEFYNGEVNNFLKSYYGKATPDMSNFENWGHFSQVVWAGTKHVGCAVQDCSSKGGIQGLPSDFPPYFTVCNYYPAGNVGGEYGTNIKKPKNNKTVYGNY